MTDSYTVGRYLVDRLKQLGLKHLFSIAGDYSIDWVTNYVAPGGIQVMQEVNELNAGYAADGYARINRIGALCTTYSAGALSATNAIAGAFVERVPVVLVNGAPSIQRTLNFEQTGYSSHHFISSKQTDLQVFQYITAAAVRIDSPHMAPMLIDYALTQCISARQPVYIELLEDMVDMPCAAPVGLLSPAPCLSNAASLQQAIDTIGQRLQCAQHPLIWLGPEIDRYGLHDKATALLHQLKLPFVTELMSKSVLPESDGQFVGVFDGQSSSAQVQKQMRDADFVLALGVWLTDINDLGWALDENNTAFASWQTLKFGTNFDTEVALSDLIDGLLAAQLMPKIPDFTPAAPLPSPAASDADKVTYQGFYQSIQNHIDENTLVGADASLNYFGGMALKVSAPSGFIIQSSYSSIGYMTAAATGVCLAKAENQRLMVFSGDGGFQMTAQALSTQTRFGLDPIIFIIDNGIYGVEQWLADASVFNTKKPVFDACVLHRWNYSKLADVFGCKGWKVETYGELKQAVEEAKANRGAPSIIQVVVDRYSIPDNAAWKE
ncbi:alpha-keto acid decarboxylase family protein [Allorhizobium undicola]|uniref:alpha-keto acid decarboxylase family protein n=1 Tax=Allorhizobium undicola TaxID=78527 RepID=UPI0004822456|nr:thiamine pyrophosphate-dependent enzyme [Allorhizobium undicola]